MHIHAVVEECEIVELLQQIDPKTKKPMRKRVLFVKNGAIVLCRIQVGFVALLVINFTQHFLLENFETIINVANNSQIEIDNLPLPLQARVNITIDLLVDSQVNNMICIEKFSDFPQLGRFTLRTEGEK